MVKQVNMFAQCYCDQRSGVTHRAEGVHLLVHLVILVANCLHDEFYLYR